MISPKIKKAIHTEINSRKVIDRCIARSAEDHPGPQAQAPGDTERRQRRCYSSRLMIDATYPAPNPLSIFTTVTFDAHEFSIPSSAAIPLYDAP